MTTTVCGHVVEREIARNGVQYRCADCELSGQMVLTFERYDCDQVRKK